MRLLSAVALVLFTACSASTGGVANGSDASPVETSSGSAADRFCARQARCSKAAVTVEACLAENGTKCIGPIMTAENVAKHDGCSCDKSVKTCGRELGSAAFQSFRTACVAKIGACGDDTDSCEELIWLTDDAFIEQARACLSGTCEAFQSCLLQAARTRNPACG